jgi:ribosomal-protein-serine acetyltransferase
VEPADGDWLVDRPAETITTDDLALTRTSSDDVTALVVAINESLDHLRPWMVWAETPATPSSMGAFADEASVAWSIDRDRFEATFEDGRG